MRSNFQPATAKKLSTLSNLNNLVGGLASVIPTIISPKKNAAQEYVVGTAKVITADEFNLGRIGVTRSGFPASMTSDEFQKFNNTIDRVIAANPKVSTGGLQSAMSNQGIHLTIDGLGSIYRDQKANRIIDFNSGIEPTGTRLSLASELNQASTTVKQFVRVQVSDNQFLALTSLLHHIGPTNFAGSTLIVALNEGRYEDVPSLMQRWRTGAVSASGMAQVRPDYVQRRLFEAELFSTPDYVSFSFNLNQNQAKNFAQLTNELVTAKDEQLG